MYQGSTGINDQWSVNHIFQYRSKTVEPQLGTLFWIAGINYKLPDSNFSFRLGFNEIDKDRDNAVEGDQYLTTRKIIQWIFHRHRYHKLRLMENFRQEQIWKEGGKLTHISRLMVSMDYPLGNENMNTGTWYLSAYTEMFFHSEDLSFDRNRTYGAIGLVAADNLKVRLGYMTEIFEDYHIDQWMVTFNHKI